jgi:hypothetical protein
MLLWFCDREILMYKSHAADNQGQGGQSFACLGKFSRSGTDLGEKPWAQDRNIGRVGVGSTLHSTE